jgi:hypothetical protein
MKECWQSLALPRSLDLRLAVDRVLLASGQNPRHLSRCRSHAGYYYYAGIQCQCVIHRASTRRSKRHTVVLLLLLIMHCIHRRSRRAIYDRSECVECCGSNTPPPSLPRWHASSAYAFKYAAFSFFLFNRLPPFTRRHSMPHVTTGKCQHRPRPLYSHGMRHLYPP